VRVRFARICSGELLSNFFNRLTAVRLLILFVAAAVSFSVVQVVGASSSSTETPRAVPSPSGAAPVEAAPPPVGAETPADQSATPLPAPAQVAGTTAKKNSARAHAKKHHARHHRHGKADRRAHRKAAHHKAAHHKARHHKAAHHKARHHKAAHHKARHHKARHHKTHVTRPRPDHAPRHNHWRHAGGRDISWPQCPTNVGFGGRNGLGQPMPDPGVAFVVVGLTNGRAFTPNPCLDEHLTWVRNHHAAAAAYAFAAFPSRAQLRRHRNNGPYDGRTGFGALRNAGHAAAGYNIRVMRRHGFTSPHVWLDVEPSSSHPWSHRPKLNRAVVRGWIRGYRDAGYTIGVYSTPLLWRHILGGFRPGLPEWRTAGPSSPRAALGRCSDESIQGGPAVIAQWWTDRRDFDRLCPSADRRTTMATYFHQW
jgi:hypothetical protein